MDGTFKAHGAHSNTGFFNENETSKRWQDVWMFRWKPRHQLAPETRLDTHTQKKFLKDTVKVLAPEMERLKEELKPDKF